MGRPGRAGSPKVTSVAFTGTGVTVVDQDGQHAVPCGDGAWEVASGDLGPVAGSASWTGPDTYLLQVQLLETPFRRTLEFRFRDGGVTVPPPGDNDPPSVEALLSRAAICGGTSSAAASG